MSVQTVHKTTITKGLDDKLNFILTDMTPDNFDDILGDPDHPELGWDFSIFRTNPIALWSHDSKAPIGRWDNIRVQNKQVHGQLVMAPAGTSAKIDELRALVASNILRGVSVGCRPTQSKPRASGGIHYLRQILVECSLCAVPANPAALLQAKALGVSNELIKQIFREGRDLTLGDRIARSRALTRRARAAIAAATPKAPKLLTASDKAVHRAAVHARAKALLANFPELETERDFEAKLRAAMDEYDRTREISPGIPQIRRNPEPTPGPTFDRNHRWHQPYILWNGKKIPL